MKKVFFVMLFIGILSFFTCTYANETDNYIEDLEKISYEFILNDKPKIIDGYLMEDSGIYYVNFKDMITCITNNYIEKDYRVEVQQYIGKTNYNNVDYYFWVDADIAHNWTVKDIRIDRCEKGKIEEIHVYPISGIPQITINDVIYVDIYCVPFIYQNFGYMTKMDLENRKIFVKSEIDETQPIKYSYISRFEKQNNVKLYFDKIINTLSYYNYVSGHKTQYDYFKGLTDDNYQIICTQLMEKIWGIKVNDDSLSIKYNQVLDVYVVDIVGEYEQEEPWIFADNLPQKLVVRKFDGRILYPYICD